ncbi:MAG: pancreas/duodenum homeobox protein 1 [Desulfosarcinaceae bacterium]|nr:pancreas/duodenum homeobox protein 1 [Desulfosarcinaceae bacterium]
MSTDPYASLFTAATLTRIFPPERTDAFFEALLGDADDGSYDIELVYDGFGDNQLRFDLRLHQRPGKCLACNLTYGLPQVFSRHPVINLDGVVDRLDQLLGETANCVDWQLGRTREVSRELHIVPLRISLGSG